MSENTSAAIIIALAAALVIGWTAIAWNVSKKIWPPNPQQLTLIEAVRIEVSEYGCLFSGEARQLAYLAKHKEYPASDEAVEILKTIPLCK